MKISGKEKKRYVLPVWPDGNAQLKGLAELEKRCQKMMQEVKLSSERQEVLKGMVGDKKIRLQSGATEQYYEQIFEETKELEEKEIKKRLCYLCRKKHTLWRYQKQRDEARKAAKIWKLERDDERGGLTGPSYRTFSPLSHAGHRRWTFLDK